MGAFGGDFLGDPQNLENKDKYSKSNEKRIKM
jgi:hypothetical protein